MTVGPISCYDCVLYTVLGSVHGRIVQSKIKLMNNNHVGFTLEQYWERGYQCTVLQLTRLSTCKQMCVNRSQHKQWSNYV